MLPSYASRAVHEDAAHFNGSLQLDAGDAPDPDGDGTLSTNWSYVHPFGAAFAIRMPGHPHRTEGQFNASGSARPTTIYTVESPTESWQVIVTNLTPRPDARTFASVVATFTASGWRVTEEGPAHVQGFPGRSYVLVSADGRSTSNLRLYATESSLFGVRVTTPTADWTTRSAQVADYFNSLRIL
jgi:hypothetical protein